MSARRSLRMSEEAFAATNAKRTRWQAGTKASHVADTESTSGGVDGRAGDAGKANLGVSLTHGAAQAGIAGIKPGPLTHSTPTDTPASGRVTGGAEGTRLLPVTLILPWPPSGNHAVKHTRTGGHYLTEDVKRFRSAVVSIVAQTRARPVHSPYSAEVIWFPPDRRRRDGDNCRKSLGDALVKAGVIADDSMLANPKYTESVVPAKQPREGYVQITLREIA